MTTAAELIADVGRAFGEAHANMVARMVESHESADRIRDYVLNLVHRRQEHARGMAWFDEHFPDDEEDDEIVVPRVPVEYRGYVPREASATIAPPSPFGPGGIGTGSSEEVPCAAEIRPPITGNRKLVRSGMPRTSVRSSVPSNITNRHHRPGDAGVARDADGAQMIERRGETVLPG